MKINTKQVLLSVVLAGFLVGCGGSSDNNTAPENPENPQNPPAQTGDLKKVEVSNARSFALNKVASQTLNDYFEAGDTKIASLDGSGDKLIVAMQWHNALGVIDTKTNELKLTPYAASKTAGKEPVDAVTGASETEINKIQNVSSFVFANIYHSSTKQSDPNFVGLHKIKINADGSVAKVAKTPNGENYKDFIVSNDGNTILATDGANIITLDNNLQEKSSKEAEVITWNFSKDNQPLIVYKDGITPIFSNKSDLGKVETLNFLPAFVKDAGNSIIFVEEGDKKAIKIHTLSGATRAVSAGVSIPEITGKNLSYDISADGKFLAVGHSAGLSVVELYSGKMNVLYTKDGVDARKGVKFVSGDKISYAKGLKEMEIASFTETNTAMSQSDLIVQKLQKLNSCDINNCLPFTEVRKDMDFSQTTILGALGVQYEPTGELSKYIANDGKLTQPSSTVSGNLKLTGTLNGKTGVREIPLTLIGTDVANTITFNGEKVINANVFGDKVVVATSKGFRTYKINGEKLEAIGDVVLPDGIDMIAPYGTFENTVTHKINNTTILGLGYKYNGQTVKVKSRGKDKEIKLYDTKVFKTTLGANGVNKNVEFIDVGQGDIINIDVSGDKKTLGVLFSASPKYIDDTANAGFKKMNEGTTSAKLYDLNSNSVKKTIELTRDASDTHAENVISLNNDASKIMVSESHHGVMKLFNQNGTREKSFGDAKFTGKLNHMSANFIAGDYIIGAPFKSPTLGYISMNDLDTLSEVDYAPSGKGWYQKAFIDGEKVYFATSSYYAKGEAGLATFDLSTKKLDFKGYKMYGGTTAVDLIDADLAGDKILLSGNAGKKGQEDGYINIQAK